jgi:IS605 OrfB family transposase
MKFRKKTAKSQSIQFEPVQIKFDNKRNLIIMPNSLKENKIFKYGKFNRKFRNIGINHLVKITRVNNRYFINIPYNSEELKATQPNSEDLTYCGIDPGVRDLMTVFGNEKIETFTVKQGLMNNINKKIDKLKTPFKVLPSGRKIGYVRKRRKKLTKLERKKSNLMDEIHHKVINEIVSSNDVIFYGDINSHDIVKKNNYNKRLNRDVNDIKFYKFKERLIYKCKLFGKKIFMVNEAFTTKTCSCCGNIYEIGKSKIYNCLHCQIKLGRDTNGAKNILMKGILENVSL